MCYHELENTSLFFHFQHLHCALITTTTLLQQNKTTKIDPLSHTFSYVVLFIQGDYWADTVAVTFQLP